MQGRVNATQLEIVWNSIISSDTPERQMQGRVNATQLEFCLSVYGDSFKSSLTELSVNVQTGHLKRNDCDK